MPHFRHATDVQSLLFDKRAFTVARAKAWARVHGFRYGKVDAGGPSAGYVRLRQHDPGEYRRSTLRTIDLTDGVRAITGVPLRAAADTRPTGYDSRGPTRNPLSRKKQAAFDDLLHGTHLRAGWRVVEDDSRQKVWVNQHLAAAIYVLHGTAYAHSPVRLVRDGHPTRHFKWFDEAARAAEEGNRSRSNPNDVSGLSPKRAAETLTAGAENALAIGWLPEARIQIDQARQIAHAAWPSKWAQDVLIEVARLRVLIERHGRKNSPRRYFSNRRRNPNVDAALHAEIAACNAMELRLSPADAERAYADAERSLALAHGDEKDVPAIVQYQHLRRALARRAPKSVGNSAKHRFKKGDRVSGDQGARGQAISHLSGVVDHVEAGPYMTVLWEDGTRTRVAKRAFQKDTFFGGWHGSAGLPPRRRNSHRGM